MFPLTFLGATIISFKLKLEALTGNSAQVSSLGFEFSGLRFVLRQWFRTQGCSCLVGTALGADLVSSPPRLVPRASLGLGNGFCT